jgi:hypothetical protein
MKIIFLWLGITVLPRCKSGTSPFHNHRLVRRSTELALRRDIRNVQHYNTISAIRTKRFDRLFLSIVLGVEINYCLLPCTELDAWLTKLEWRDGTFRIRQYRICVAENSNHVHLNKSTWKHVNVVFHFVQNSNNVAHRDGQDVDN